MTAPLEDRLAVAKEKLTVHGFKLSPRSRFEVEAPRSLVKRAADRALGFGGYSVVVWDTLEGDDGWLLIGDNETQLLTEWAYAFPDLMDEDH